MSKPKPSAGKPSSRGYRLSDVCTREDISRRTAWRWVEKGVLKVSRVAPRTGVRVQYADAEGDEET